MRRQNLFNVLFTKTRINLSLIQTYFNIKSERFLLQSIISLKIQFDRKEIGPLFILRGFSRVFILHIIHVAYMKLNMVMAPAKWSRTILEEF